MLNTASPEKLQCLYHDTALKREVDMTVLEKQRAAPQWQQDQSQSPFQYHLQQHSNFNELSTLSIPEQEQNFHVLNDMILDQPVKQDSRMVSGWLDFGSSYANDSGGGGGYMEEVVAAGDKGKECIAAEKLSAAVGKESFKKRKPEDDTPEPKVKAEENTTEKKLKACREEDQSKNKDQKQNSTKSTSSDNTRSNKNNNGNKKNGLASACKSKENSKVSEVQKRDYIHVRARRGQATDSHSLAERIRREKISERMKYLQDLVPGCNKITGKAGMLDEIINYVQALQQQVEFLSMKLAAINPRLDFNVEDLYVKEVFPATQLAMRMSSDLVNQSYLQLYPFQHTSPTSSFDVDINLRRSVRAPSTITETFPDSPGFNQQIHNPLSWEAELQNIFAMEFLQARPNSFPSLTYTGSVEGTNFKMEK